MWRWIFFVEAVFLCCGQRAWSQNPARQAGYLYLSPMPQASYTSAHTRYVLVRFVNVAPSAVANLTNGFISVTGASSGAHSGGTRIASDGRTVIFEVNSPFNENELISVSLAPVLAAGATGTLQSFTYQFMTSGPMPGSLPLVVRAPQAWATTPVCSKDQPLSPRTSAQPGQRRPGKKAMVMLNGVSVPSNFPKAVITVNTNPSPGYLFLVNGLDGVPPYTMMLDNNGLPVWYRQGRMYDFKIQKNGMITWALSDNTGFPAFDQNFNYLKTYLTTNGYLTDSHDLKILPDGSYYMIGYQTNRVDMSKYVAGGTWAIVRETAVQGFTAADELIFQWRSWDHYNLQDLGGNSDFPHMNGLDIDEDGNILVSARHLSEITKIDRDSGDIIWRLSGKHNQFTFVDDPLLGTSFQHNISALGHGHYMVFDNGDSRSPAISRAVEYQLDLTNMTATMVWQFRDVPDKYTYWLGSAQRLPSGNTLIDFVLAQYPKAIEVDTNGIKRFELSLVPSSDSYRAFRFPWNGVVAAPYLVVEPQADNITLVFNKFGDTNVALYRIYGGTSPQPTTVLTESAAPLKQLTDLPTGPYYFRVTAVDKNGLESPFSNEQSVYVNITAPGQNMVQNGDFSQGSNPWLFNVSGSTASATWAISNNVSRFNITGGGASPSSVELLQGHLALILGDQYVLQFDAWSDQTRYIQAQLAQSISPYSDYSGLAATFLTPNPTHFRYVFTMQHPSDFSANLLFQLGGAVGTVYLDNVSLFTPAAGDLNLDRRVDLMDLDIFCGDWLQKHSGLRGDVDRDGVVNFDDFRLFGQNWGLGSP